MNKNELINNALRNASASYLVRDTGSYVEGQTRDRSDVAGGEQVREFLLSQTWEEVTEDARKNGTSYGQCRYFTAALDESVQAFEAVRTWGSLSPQEREEVVIVVSGHASDVNGHKYELHARNICPVRKTFLTLCVGNADGPERDPSENATVYAWVPGSLGFFTPVTKEMVEGGNFPPSTMVKLAG